MDTRNEVINTVVRLRTSSLEPAQWRKSTMAVTVADGFSSLNQGPEWGMATSWTLLAAARKTTAAIAANDAPPPTALTSTGRKRRAAHAPWSRARWSSGL